MPVTQPKKKRPKAAGPGRPVDPTLDSRILQATLAILSKEGYFGLTLDSVAKRTGIPKSTIYRRWRSKGQLFAQAVSGSLEFGNSFIDTGSVVGDLSAILKRDREAAKRPGLADSVLGLLIEARSDPTVISLLRQIMQKRSQNYMLAFQHGIARGEIDPNADLNGSLSMLLGLFWHRLLSGSGSLDDSACERLARQLVEGIQPK